MCGLRRLRRGAARDPLRQPPVGRARAARQRRALPPAPARARLALPLPAAPVRPGPRQREGQRWSGPSATCATPSSRRALHDARGPQPPGAGVAGRGGARAALARTTSARRSPRPSRRSAAAAVRCPCIPSRPTSSAPSAREDDLRPLRPQRLLDPARGGRPCRSPSCASETAVRILDGTTEIARHRRSYDRAPARRGPRPRSRRCSRSKRRGARARRRRARLTGCRPRGRGLPRGALRQRASRVAATTEKLLLPARRLRSRRAARPPSARPSSATHPASASVAFLLARRRRTAQRRPAPLPVDLSRRPDLKRPLRQAPSLGDLR